MKIIQVENITNFFLSDNDKVKVTRSGNVTEVQYLSNANKKQIIKKIDKDSYVNLETGELKLFVHNENRADDLRSIQKTMKLGRDIINSNITDPKKAKFITLTYAENMTDTKKLKRDTEFFIRKIKRRYDGIEYITAIEPQERGAWHFHMILLFPDIAPFIPNDLIHSLWVSGWTSTKKIDDVDNVGAYLTGYLAHIEATPQTAYLADSKSEFKIDKENNKIYIKGGRLKLYPKGMRIFRYSKGIKKPIVEHMKYKDIKKEIGSVKPTYKRTIKIENDNFNSLVHKEFYNSSRLEYHEDDTN